MANEEVEQEDNEEHDVAVHNDINDENNFLNVNNDLKYPIRDVIELEKYTMENLLSLYNIT